MRRFSGGRWLLFLMLNVLWLVPALAQERKGFTPFTTEVNVSGGQVTHVDGVLQVGSQSEVVTVRGERERGELEAINRERTADNIVQVLPADVITSLPNTDIADAVGRLPSVSLERDEGEGKYVQIRGGTGGKNSHRSLGLRWPTVKCAMPIRLGS
jgi:hypothetical protein